MIKFRAWDKRRKEMWKVATLHIEDEYADLFKTNIYENPFNDPWAKFEDLILMQSTGLKDKNGVEIFEGDVFESGYARYVVFWQKDDVRFALKFIHDFEDSYYLDMRNIESMDLIGNIHENPELAS